MVFGLKELLPRRFSDFFGGQNKTDKKDRRNFCYLEGTSARSSGSSPVKRGIKRAYTFNEKDTRAKYLKRARSNTAIRYNTKRRNLKRSSSRIPISDSDDTILLNNPQTPVKLLRRIWNLRREGLLNTTNQRPQDRPGTASRKARAKYERRNRRGRSLQRRRKDAGRSRPSSSRKSRKKNGKRVKGAYPTRTRDLKDIRVRRIKRYYSGEEERERAQVKPFMSISADKDRVFKEKPKSFQMKSETGGDNNVEDPLNHRKLHRTYVKRLYGVPARIVGESRESRRKYRRKKFSSRKKSSCAKKKAERNFWRRLKRRRQAQQSIRYFPRKRRN